MMYLLYIIALVSALFLNSHLSTLLGLSSHAEVAFLPMLVYLAITLFTQKMRYDKISVYLLILAFLILLFKWSVGQNYIYHVFRLLFIPALVFICFDHLSRKQSTTLRWIMILFYVLFCVIAITEKILSRHFFPVSTDIEWHQSIGYFRSNSIFWHPLSGAFFVAFFMVFVAVADFKKKYFQIFLFFLGYIALFCFDGRSAILVATFILLPYFLWKLYKVAGERRWMIIFGIVVMLSGVIFLITETSLGTGRLMGEELMDSSGQTRLDVFNFYKHYKHQDDFLWGNPGNYQYMMERLGAGGVENGVITLILEYGVFFTPIILLLFFLLQYRSLSVFTNFEKWMLLIVFFGLGSTNPNLASGIFWSLWVFAYYTFRPESQVEHLSN